MTRKLSAATLVGVEDLVEPAHSGTVSRLTPEPEQVVVSLPVTSIRPSRHQPRRAFAAEGLQDLATSIAERGVLQPIVVRPNEDGEDAAFELIVGERRWRAAQIAGLATIRAIVDGVDNATSAEMALTENMARDDLNPIEEASGCAALRDSFGMTVTQIARRVGRDRTAISHLIRLLELPASAQQQIADGRLSEGHGRILLRLGDHDERSSLARQCAAASWSVRELERRVDAHSVTTTKPAPMPADQVESVRALSERLEPVCGSSSVTIVPRRRGSYEIRVQCEDYESLTGTVDRLAASAESARRKP